MKHPMNLFARKQQERLRRQSQNLAPETVIHTFMQMLERLRQSGLGAAPMRGQFSREKP